ncbi:MAG: PEP-CTERM sorting domain-containing protein [Betaproteobacteria bacterium]|nr:PEP-CTERM sorting domain-containing protein [Betaproteobacteria bacterium]
MQRGALRGALGIVLLLGGAANAAAPFSYIGQQIVPTGTMAFGTTVGGLSGIDFDAAASRYFAISDDRSQLNPARFYRLGLDLNQFQRSNAAGSAGVMFDSVTPILAPGGTAFAPAQLDPEAIRLAGTSLYWTSEGARDASGLQNPFVRRMGLNGAHQAELATPSRFNPAGSIAGTQPADSGIRNNLSFESLTLSTDRTRVYAATENALVQDGPAAAFGQSSVSRVIEFDLASGSRTAEYSYVVDAVAAAPVPSGSFATNGLVEMLAIGEGQFITVERAFSTGVGNSIRLYYADARGATDIAGLDSLAGGSYTPMTKSLLLDLGALRNDDGSPLLLDNIEGITFGPELDGSPSIILVSDNNFSPAQFTQFIALSQVGAIPEPETYALMLVGLGLVLAARRRRR